MHVATPSAAGSIAANIYKSGTQGHLPVDFHFPAPSFYHFTVSWSLKWNPLLTQVNKNNGETSTPQKVPLSISRPLKQIFSGKNFCLRLRVSASKALSLWSTQPAIDLAMATSDENAQLVDKVKELEVEVTVWKRAHSTASRESNAMGPKNLAFCTIDGTRSIFSTSYFTEGEAGGRKAGQEIIRGIVDYLADASSLQDSTVKLSISIYITKDRLRNDLASICPRGQFDKFFVGLNETPYLNIVEVNSKRDADKKIDGEYLQVKLNSSDVPHPEHLQLFAGLPQTARVFFSGL